MEIPNLSTSTIWGLDNHISIVNQVEVSVFFELRDDVEVFFDNEAILFVKFALHWISFPFIYINNVPLLMKTIISLIDSDVSLFCIYVSNYFNHFASLIDNILILEPKKLPPSRVSRSAS